MSDPPWPPRFRLPQWFASPVDEPFARVERVGDSRSDHIIGENINSGFNPLLRDSNLGNVDHQLLMLLNPLPLFIVHRGRT